MKTKTAASVKKPKLSKRQMVVEVAKDVLKLMRHMNVVLRTAYLSPLDYFDNNMNDFDGDPAALQKNIPKIAKQCEVCAKGAMVLAHVHLYDGVDCLPDNDHASEFAQQLFGVGQADLIERYFEQEEGPISHLDGRARLRKIMNNIIANEGIFKPSQL